MRRYAWISSRVGVDDITHETREILKGNGKKGRISELWDGKAAERMVNVLADKLAAYEEFKRERNHF